jgi:Na+/melibiose symporter-like transporter
LWKQVFGLTAVQVAISLMWLIYGTYLPQLLGDFGMPVEIGGVLFVIENGIAIATQPLMGNLSDRALYWMGSRFPFIAAGVILASAFFVALPVLALVGRPGMVMQWVAIFALVSWALAMTIFQSPVLSLLMKYASIRHLPLAASLLTVATALIGTARPVVNQMILSLGPLATFLVGSMVLLGAAAVLRSLDPPTSPAGFSPTVAQPLSMVALLLIAILGFSIGWGNRLVMDSFGKVFSAQLPEANVPLLMGTVGFGIAAIAIPAGLAATRWGNRLMLCLGLLLAIAFSELMVLLPQRLVLLLCVVILIAALSLVLNGVFPLVLSLIPAAKGGLGVGTYLGGLAASAMVFGMAFRQPELIPVEIGTFMGAIAFFLATVCVLASSRLPSPQIELKT